jgi:copper chaperone NosL
VRPAAPVALPQDAGVALVLAVAVACASGPLQPAPLDTRNEQCASCRMGVSDPRFAAQVIAPGELPHFFDDVGCLADWLKEHEPPPGAIAFVADHRTKEWIRADRALYTRNPGLETPMSSHLIAHAAAASRDADPDARGGTDVSAATLFGPGGPPAGGPR